MHPLAQHHAIRAEELVTEVRKAEIIDEILVVNVAQADVMNVFVLNSTRKSSAFVA
jgi:hypothetical protein